jgi:hypothetical protein
MTWQPIVRVTFSAEEFEAIARAARTLGIDPGVFVQGAALREVRMPQATPTERSIAAHATHYQPTVWPPEGDQWCSGA